MSARRLLVIGSVGVLPGVVVGLVLRSWDGFVLTCLGVGLLVEVAVTMAIHGQAPPRSPEENLRQMKANQYGYVAGVEVPADVRSWRSVLLGVPALCVGALGFVIVASLR